MPCFDSQNKKEIDKREAASKTVVAAVTAPNATDLASAQTLANANKTQLNALIAALKAGGYIS